MVARCDGPAVQQHFPHIHLLQRHAALQRHVGADVLHNFQSQHAGVERLCPVHIGDGHQHGTVDRRGLLLPAAALFQTAAVPFPVFLVVGVVMQRLAGKFRAAAAVGQLFALAADLDGAGSPKGMLLLQTAGTAGALFPCTLAAHQPASGFGHTAYLLFPLF